MKNRGITLLEVLLVVAVLGILVGMGSSSMNKARFADARVCADYIESYLNELRLKALTNKGEAYLIIFQDTDKNYYITIQNNYTVSYHKKQGKKIANSRVKIIGVSDSFEQQVEGETGQRIILSMCRETGALKPVDSTVYSSILIVSNKKKYRIVFIKKTGRYLVRRES